MKTRRNTLDIVAAVAALLAAFLIALARPAVHSLATGVGEALAYMGVGALCVAALVVAVVAVGREPER